MGVADHRIARYFFGRITNICAHCQGLVTNLITAGHGREAAFAAAVLGDNALMEKAWQDTGMLAEAVLHSQVSYILSFFPCIFPILVHEFSQPKHYFSIQSVPLLLP